MPFSAGTYIFDNGIYTFTIVIPSNMATTQVLVTLTAPKAIPLTDLFNPDYWSTP